MFASGKSKSWQTRVYPQLFVFSEISLISDIPKSECHYSTPYHSSSEQIKVTDWTFHTVTAELITHSFFNTFSEWMLRGLRHKGQLAWFNSTVRSLKMCAIVHKGMAMEVDGLLQIHHDVKNNPVDGSKASSLFEYDGIWVQC